MTRLGISAGEHFPNSSTLVESPDESLFRQVNAHHVTLFGLQTNENPAAFRMRKSKTSGWSKRRNNDLNLMILGFIILAHDRPDSIRKLVDIIAVGRNQVVIHFDVSARAADLEAVKSIAAEKPDQVRVISRAHCVWGEWSLVDAVLHSLREFKSMSQPPDYVHLMSGADFPIRPLGHLERFLRNNPDRDFIECCDISERAWVKGGLGKERFRFYFPFNFRTHRKAFDRSVRWQRKLKIRRRLPEGLRPHMGSQWWTMRWSTCRAVLDFTEKHPKVPRYFKSTWIPDESYFQTLVAKLVPKSQIADLQLMFHHLTPSGRPYVFYNDHLEIARKLPHFFIRKVSPEAKELHEKLYQENPSRTRIPSLRILARVRDLVRGKIDENHTFTTSVPGYYQGKPAVVSDNKGGQTSPQGTPQAAAVLREVTGPPIITLFVEDPGLSVLLEKMVDGCQELEWLGRPYSPGCIRMDAEHLARMGLVEKSYKTRDAFVRQFNRYLLEATPGSKIPVALMILPDDSPGALSTGLPDQLLPLLVITPSLAVHTLSQMRLAIHAASPVLSAKTIEVDLEDLPKVFENLVRDSRLWHQWKKDGKNPEPVYSPLPE